MLRITAQINFSKLYMERSSKRSEFFQKVKTLIQWKVYGKRNKKNILKRPGNKRTPAYSGISLFTMMLLSKYYNLVMKERENW
ncbi:MAG: hypothetical protein ACMUEL_09805 [Flavobacteriales bacterium Tduv]